MNPPDPSGDATPETIAEIIDRAMDSVPFGRWLGLHLTGIEGDRVLMHLSMRDEFVGNPARNILHGGVISAVLDTVGGFAAFLGVLTRGGGDTKAVQASPWLSTIDMRTDYLRPGIGNAFTAEAFPLRVGNRLVVIRTEFRNDACDLIAVGTGTYVVP
ncbi:MAG: thioesterase family protein [Acidimicrobiia bacterium]|nr:MAG: thioesterase family protein [Acidimicrobiia bacterium]